MAVNATMSSRSSSPKRTSNFQDSRGVWRRPNGTILPLDESPSSSRASSPRGSRSASPSSPRGRSKSPKRTEDFIDSRGRARSPDGRYKSTNRSRSPSPKRTEDFVDSHGRERSPDGRYKPAYGSSSPRSGSPRSRSPSPSRNSSGHGVLGMLFYSAISQLAKQQGKKIDGGVKVSYEILEKIKLHHKSVYVKMTSKDKITVKDIHDMIHADSGAHKKISMHYIDRV